MRGLASHDTPQPPPRASFHFHGEYAAAFTRRRRTRPQIPLRARRRPMRRLAPRDALHGHAGRAAAPILRFARRQATRAIGELQ